MSIKISPYAGEVAKHLLSIGVIEFNVAQPFTWVSGIKAPVYCDNRKINSDVEARSFIADTFIKVIEKNYPEVEAIAGVATGGIPQGMLIADRMRLPFVYVRQAAKGHGKMQQVEGSFHRGEKVVLIEDHISTGGSSFKAVKGLGSAGLDMLGLISIMTYGFKSAETLFENNNVNYLSLCDLDTVLEVAHNEGRISREEQESVLAFLRDPKRWGEDQL